MDMIGIQIIHLKKFCVPVSTGTSKVDKLLKMPSDSILEGVIFQNFLGGMPPDHLVLMCFACLCTLHTMSVNMPASPTSTMMTGLAVPPSQKSRSAPDQDQTSSIKASYNKGIHTRVIARLGIL